MSYSEDWPGAWISKWWKITTTALKSNGPWFFTYCLGQKQLLDRTLYTATDQKISCAHGPLRLHAEHVQYIEGNFGIPFWNIYDRNMDCRTNNKAEVFHRASNNCVRVCHPNFWIYIRHLKDLQSFTESDITTMNWGGRLTRRSHHWQHLENRLIQLKSEYDRGEKCLDDYWNTVSHLIHHHRQIALQFC